MKGDPTDTFDIGMFISKAALESTYLKFPVNGNNDGMTGVDRYAHCTTLIMEAVDRLYEIHGEDFDKKQAINGADAHIQWTLRGFHDTF